MNESEARAVLGIPDGMGLEIKRVRPDKTLEKRPVWADCPLGGGVGQKVCQHPNRFRQICAKRWKDCPLRKHALLVVLEETCTTSER